ncbi:MAG: hypothetical protein JSS81_06015 [Acidobacteria bacterium]|nr:hypothetical protein [Acidobacteriota bacterium]
MKNQPCHQTWCGGDQETSAAEYLQTVEDEFSRIRGRWSPLGPLDWNLADKWRKDDVPLSVVIRAMDAVHKKFQESKRRDSINSLRYFEKQVEIEFAEWLSRQVGKSEPAEAGPMVALAISDETDVLHYFVSAYDRPAGLPEPIASAVSKAQQQLLDLLNESEAGLSETATENRLEVIAADLELSMVVSLPDDERARMLERIKIEYQKISINDESRQKLLIKQAYAYFWLPKLTLFEL